MVTHFESHSVQKVTDTGSQRGFIARSRIYVEANRREMARSRLCSYTELIGESGDLDGGVGYAVEVHITN